MTVKFMPISCREGEHLLNSGKVVGRRDQPSDFAFRQRSSSCPSHLDAGVPGAPPGLQYALPRADTGQSVSTLPLRMPTYQSCTLQVGSQCPGTSRSFSLIFSTPLASSMTPCSSEHLTYFTSSRP